MSTIPKWPTYKGIMRVHRDLGDRVAQLASEDTVHATRSDRTAPISYWCDCPENYRDFYGRKPGGWVSIYPMLPAKLVGSNDEGLSATSCRLCGHEALARRIHKDNWPVNVERSKKRTVVKIAIASGERTEYDSVKQAIKAGESSVAYALRSGHVIKGVRWIYKDGLKTRKKG